LTPGNVDDRTPIPQLVQRVFGKLFGDNGYLSQALFAQETIPASGRTSLA